MKREFRYLSIVAGLAGLLLSARPAAAEGSVVDRAALVLVDDLAAPDLRPSGAGGARFPLSGTLLLDRSLHLTLASGGLGVSWFFAPRWAVGLDASNPFFSPLFSGAPGQPRGESLGTGGLVFAPTLVAVVRLYL